MFFDLSNIDNNNTLKNEYEIVIIGGGPAGISAAIYSIQGGVQPLIIEKSMDGGQMNLTELVENYPGFKTIEGHVIGEKMGAHARHFGAEFLYSYVEKVEIKDKYKIIYTDNGKIIKAKVLIIASGAVPKSLNAEGEKKYTGRGVSYCATCDGHFFKNEKVAIIGGGNTALEEALFMSKIAKEITIIHRRDKFRADKMYQDRIFNLNNVKYIWDSEIIEFKGDKQLNSLVYKNRKTDEIKEEDFKGAFIFIGLTPVTKYLNNEIKTNDAGYILTDKHMRTNIDGIYAVGDIIEKELRQIVTAVSDGAIAASHAIRNYFN